MLDRPKMHALRAKIEEALRAVEKEFPGTTLSLGNGRFDSLTASFRLNIFDNTETTHAGLTLMGAIPAKNTEFLFRGKTYRVVAYAPSRWKYPVTAERIPDGKRFKFPADAVK